VSGLKVDHIEVTLEKLTEQGYPKEALQIVNKPFIKVCG
jgi:hypothetical protein